MRHFILALALTSTTAFAACPNLSGKYTSCFSSITNQEEPADSTVTQRTVGNATEYTLKYLDTETNEYATDIFVTDGKIRSSQVPDADDTFVLISATCNNKNEAVLNISIKSGNETFPFGTQTYSKSGNVLKIVSKTEGISDTVTCK